MRATSSSNSKIDGPTRSRTGRKFSSGARARQATAAQVELKMTCGRPQLGVSLPLPVHLCSYACETRFMEAEELNVALNLDVSPSGAD